MKNIRSKIRFNTHDIIDKNNIIIDNKIMNNVRDNVYDKMNVIYVYFNINTRINNNILLICSN
jgi:hypothetical protein